MPASLSITTKEAPSGRFVFSFDGKTRNLVGRVTKTNRGWKAHEPVDDEVIAEGLTLQQASGFLAAWRMRGESR